MEKGNTFAATAFISYGFFWLLARGIGRFAKLGCTGTNLRPPISPCGELFTGVMFLGTFRLNRALQVVFGTLTILFFLLA